MNTNLDPQESLDEVEMYVLPRDYRALPNVLLCCYSPQDLKDLHLQLGFVIDALLGHHARPQDIH